MQVTKRNGDIVDFNRDKITNAICKAFKEVDGEVKYYNQSLAELIAHQIEDLNKDLTVEEIQDIVVSKLLDIRRDVGLAYERYRYKRSLIRGNTTDDTILEIVDNKSEYWGGENANKNPRLNTTIRDYMAGATSTDISRRILLPSHITKAHDEGIIHFHDIDYFIQKMFNCQLINLEDMLQNGTVITGTLIEKPHSFSTACTISTQIIAQVASAQYGGQTVSLAHLAPFVEVSRQALRKEIIQERIDNGDDLDEEKINHTVNRRLKKDISKGIQTIQYQITTLNVIGAYSRNTI